VAAARRGGRDKVGCIILARDEDAKKAREWLIMAPESRDSSASRWAGRTSGSRSLAGGPEKTTRDAAVAEIAHRFREFVDIFESARVEAGAV
jgi:5-dehydro-2-deoxygluconokinase